jgi:hypothetical protein
MKRINSRYLFIVVAVMMTALVLASCANEDDDDNDSSDDAVDDTAQADDADDSDDDSSDDDDDDVDDDLDDTTADDTADDDTGVDYFFYDNFDSYALGDLPAPWSVSADPDTTMQIVEDELKSGNVVEVVDTTDTGSWAMSQMYVDFGEAPELEEKFAFEYDVYVDYTGSYIWFGLVDDTVVFFVVSIESDGAYVADQKCGDLAAGEWHTIRQILQPSNMYIKVEIDGSVVTPCAGTLGYSLDHVTGIISECWDDTGTTARYLVDNVRVYNM